jgi:hypothetical protein
MTIGLLRPIVQGDARAGEQDAATQQNLRCRPGGPPNCSHLKSRAWAGVSQLQGNELNVRLPRDPTGVFHNWGTDAPSHEPREARRLVCGGSMSFHTSRKYDCGAFRPSDSNRFLNVAAWAHDRVFHPSYDCHQALHHLHHSHSIAVRASQKPLTK